MIKKSAGIFLLFVLLGLNVKAQIQVLGNAGLRPWVADTSYVISRINNAAFWKDTALGIKPVNNSKIYAYDGMILGNYIYENVGGTLRAFMHMSGSPYQSVTIGSRGLADRIRQGAWLPAAIGETVSIGEYAGGNITTGVYNVFIGKAAGYNLTSETNCILIGRNIIGRPGISNQLQIGNAVFGENTHSPATTTLTIGQNVSTEAGVTLHPSAALSVNSNSKGVVIPRMTKAQRNAIASPVMGLMVIVYGETGGEYLSLYNANQTRWEKVNTTAD
jgi:hypothetical protein